MQPDALTGRSVGHHSVLEPLGEGGMGFVYKARDTRLRRLVAIKVLRPERIGEKADRRRFLREAQAAAALNHPHIVTVHEVGVEDGLDYIVMEYIAGGTLSDLMASGRLPTERVLKLAARVTEALAAAHAAGVVHRDLKPSNIMLASPEHLKVVDFGLAKFSEAARPTEADTVSRTGVLIGTAAYMSPEQIAGRAADARSDVWALGAVLYEMATGRRPFPEPNLMLLVNDILSRDPEPAGTLNPQLPPGLEKVILKALEKDPVNRYQSARDLGDDLARLTAGMPPLARPRRRSRLPLMATGVVVAALAVATGGYLWLAHRQGSANVNAVEAKPSAVKAAVAEPSSIAVLSFVNMSADADQEYFSDGLSEELLNSLANVPQLRVISRTSSFQFKGKNEDVRTIGQKLNVAHVLEGSVRRSGKRVRITAQLVSAATGVHQWSRTYERDVDDVFRLQDEIAGEVVKALQVILVDGMPSKKPTPRSTEAYTLLLKARYFSDRRTKDDSARAVATLKRALELDPNYAAAWAELARAYATQSSSGFAPVDESIAKARQAAQKALALYPDLAAAHAILGWIKSSYDWDWEAADAEFKRALELEPGSANILANAGSLARGLGRLDSIDLFRRGVARDPLQGLQYINLAIGLLYANRLEEAEAACRQAIELRPQAVGQKYLLGLILLAKGRREEAREAFGQEGDEGWRLAGQALSFHAVGRQAESDAAVKALRAKFSEDMPFQIAEVSAYRGEVDLAFQWLERARTLHDTGLLEMKGDPLLRNLTGDPRYRLFLRKMRLPT